MRFKLLGLMLLLTAFAPNTAKAVVILEFGQNGVAGINDFSAIVGETVEVDLFITQTNNETVLSDAGLIQFGTTFTIDPGSNNPAGAIHESVAGVSTFNFSSEFPNSRDANLSSDSLELATNAGSATGNGVQATGSSIYLGTASIATSALGTYNFSLTRENALSFATPTLDFLNPTDASGTLTIQAIPEPNSLMVFALFGSGAVFIRRRRHS